MPKTSLLVCLRKEYAFLSRLLERIQGNFEDLLVIHHGSEDDDQRSPISDDVVPGIDFADLLQGLPDPESLSYKSTSTSQRARLVQQWGGRFLRPLMSAARAALAIRLALFET
jgi:hypothetical protein